MQGEAGGLHHHRDKTSGKLAGSSKWRSAPCSRARVPPPTGACCNRLALAPGTAHYQGDPGHPKFQPSSPTLCSRDAVLEGGRGLWCLQDVSRPLGPTPAPSCPLTKGRSAPGQAERRRRPASVPGPPQDRQQQSAAHARRRCYGSCRSAGEVHRAAPRGRIPTTGQEAPGGSVAPGLVLAEGTGDQHQLRHKLLGRRLSPDPLQGHPSGLGSWGAFTGPRLCI